MLTQQQEEFLRKYIQDGSNRGSDHTDASQLVEQVRLEEDAEPVRSELEKIEMPAKASPTETSALNDAISSGIDSLSGTLDKEKIRAAKAQLDKARDLIRATETRVQLAEAELEQAVDKARSLISDGSLSEIQSRALLGWVEILTDVLADDLENVGAVANSLDEIAPRMAFIQKAMANILEKADELGTPPEGALSDEAKAVVEQAVVVRTLAQDIVDEPSAEKATQSASVLVQLTKMTTLAIAARAELRNEIDALLEKATVPEKATVAEVEAITGPLDEGRLVRDANSATVDDLGAAKVNAQAAVDAYSVAAKRIDAAFTKWNHAVKTLRERVLGDSL